jgi:hypothetical protein
MKETKENHINDLNSYYNRVNSKKMPNFRSRTKKNWILKQIQITDLYSLRKILIKTFKNRRSWRNSSTKVPVIKKRMSNIKIFQLTKI